ncbi:hypothetical protein [Actinomyces sp. 565]|uniref:hypothetical protein n=1 Tax=Actinomyces sp. 565 TaxID=2057794 RepID=UPI0013A7078A|nr:hypothetical protein [Actinomyces sp. 565]NDR53178.1 hypothetical protein [Actinomyces sp. 565]
MGKLYPKDAYEPEFTTDVEYTPALAFTPFGEYRTQALVYADAGVGKEFVVTSRCTAVAVPRRTTTSAAWAAGWIGSTTPPIRALAKRDRTVTTAVALERETARVRRDGAA